MSRQHEVEVLELARGGLVIYPTETFYALGCLATMHQAVEKIISAKGRPADKPLPLIVSDWEMAERFLRLTKAEEELARKFWPGPLSIVAEVDPRVSPLAKDHTGRSAVRMSPHVIAARLCHEAGAPLVSSSANRSGLPPVCRPDELDSELVRDSGALVIASTPWPSGGLPSTLVKIVGAESVRILRAGAISAREIIAAGVEVLS
ncbi:L-threonylcarbamoyladenylate synthase [Desulfomicrobium norvegicum]|uniref:L-threonylcarbamoyladenylate synthase n=1 Tax=Desulfomicrobium norvegicum (strain DSM 1741 / NCIMB 8310) TaxID=52561 RepID=A0A8G2F5P1_DESNO|nr:L-threonylcarbamoyladenylate synthase [Desulfomicrobium norvegicum]SFM07886.1 L-threonylcarbamoyladenylate synthase [Desulfomicrobium norvegicum]